MVPQVGVVVATDGPWVVAAAPLSLFGFSPSSPDGPLPLPLCEITSFKFLGKDISWRVYKIIKMYVSVHFLRTQNHC